MRPSRRRTASRKAPKWIITRTTRPSVAQLHAANLRLMLDVDLQSGKQVASKHSAPGLWELLNRMPREHQPPLDALRYWQADSPRRPKPSDDQQSARRSRENGAVLSQNSRLFQRTALNCGAVDEPSTLVPDSQFGVGQISARPAASSSFMAAGSGVSGFNGFI